MKVFVAWHFADDAARALLEACAAFALTTPAGGSIEWVIPGITLGAVGNIGSDVVDTNLRGAHCVMALVDHANANVGWEIGAALGYGKGVHLVRLRTPSTWTEQSILAGCYVNTMRDWRAVAALLGQPAWTLSGSYPESVASITHVLCPGGVEGEGLRALIEREWGRELRLGSVRGERVLNLSSTLLDCARLIWIVCGHLDAELPDGVDNTSNALVSGLAAARGIPVVVLRSRKARAITDIAGVRIDFDGLASFERELRREMSIPQFSAAVDAASTPLSILAPVKIEQLTALKEQLRRLFVHKREIQRLAALLGITDLSSDGTSEQLWADLLRRAVNGKLDVAPLVTAALRLDPGNVVLAELAADAQRQQPLSPT